jgi:DNA-binding GntR family transcriptional regulator
MVLTDAEKAYLKIKDRIVTVKMRPGAVISESELMEDLGLGRTPIREGLKRLQSENLVIVKPRRGMFVADIAITDLTQIYEVRVELEALGARLAAQRISSSQIKELHCLLEEHRETDHDDKLSLIELDKRFHQLLAESTHNNFLRNELNHYYDLSLRIWHLALHYSSPEDLDVVAHAELVEAIEGGDSQLADFRMRRHIEHFHARIKQYL